MSGVRTLSDHGSPGVAPAWRGTDAAAIEPVALVLIGALVALVVGVFGTRAFITPATRRGGRRRSPDTDEPLVDDDAAT